MTVKYRWIPAKSFTPGRKGWGGIVLHSGDGSKVGDMLTLTTGKVSAHWYVDRAGSIYHFVQDSDTAYHAGRAIDRWTNGWTIGIEQEHRDGVQDWPDAQVQSMARLVRALHCKHGYLPVRGHSEIARPKGRKQDPLAYPWSKLKALLEDLKDKTISFEKIG